MGRLAWTLVRCVRCMMERAGRGAGGSRPAGVDCWLEHARYSRAGRVCESVCVLYRHERGGARRRAFPFGIRVGGSVP